MFNKKELKDINSTLRRISVAILKNNVLLAEINHSITIGIAPERFISAMPSDIPVEEPSAATWEAPSKKSPKTLLEVFSE